MAGRAKSAENIAKRKTCKMSRLEKYSFPAKFHCVAIFFVRINKTSFPKTKNIISSTQQSQLPKCSLFVTLISDRVGRVSQLGMAMRLFLTMRINAEVVLYPTDIPLDIALQ